MKKAILLKWVNMLLFFSAVIQTATGAAFLLNLLSDQPGLFMFTLELHEWNGPVLALLIVLHISLNWGWVRSQFFRKAAAPMAGIQHGIR